MRTLAASSILLVLVASNAPLPAATAEGLPTMLLVEVQPNPVGTDAGNEWFEVHNPTPLDLSLDGWSVTDHDACFLPGAGSVPSYAFPLDGLVVPAGGELVVTIAGIGSCLSLANTGDELVLIAPNGDEWERVAWGPAAGLAAPPEGAVVAACREALLVHGAYAVAAATRGAPNAACG